MCRSAVLCQICPLGIMLEVQAHHIGYQLLQNTGYLFSPSALLLISLPLEVLDCSLRMG